MPATHGRILVVDDDPDLRRTLTSILEEEGYRVVEAADGAEALRVLRENPSFNLILFDLVMPVMDGWQFRKAQAADPGLASIPAVGMSTYQQIGDHGPPPAAAFLQKPFGAAVLSSIIKSCARAPAS